MFKFLNAKMMNKGFTLIEMLVAIAVFSIFIGAVSGVFISGIRLQREILDYQEILSQTSYAMEYMSRTVRMAKKDLGGNCISAKGNFEITVGNGLRFMNYRNECQEFFLETNQLKEDKEGVVLPLTSNDLEITKLRFNLIGQFQPPGDNLQPKVTISLEVKKAEKDQPRIKIQNTISQRNLDVQY